MAQLLKYLKADVDVDSLHTQNKWTLVRYFVALGKVMGTLCIIFGCIPLCGYLFEIEPLYRPLEKGPATHPSTAILIVLLGLCIRRKSWGRSNLAYSCIIWVVILLSALRLIELAVGRPLLIDTLPFYQISLSEAAQGKQNAQGWNTALMLLLLSLALFFRGNSQLITSQILAVISLIFPAIALTGYAYGFQSFFGDMSLMTLTSGYCMGIGTLSLTAKTGAIRVLLSPYVGGRLGRYQLVFGWLIPFMLGFLLVKALFFQPEGQLVGLYVVMVCWFIAMLVTATAMVHENIDSRRRVAEKALLKASMQDELTSIPNRRCFMEQAQKEFHRAKRKRGELWLLLLDIDHFKQVNDRAGHPVGDKVIKCLAALIQRNARISDCYCRLGGEEFALLLLDTNAYGAMQVAERIRTEFEQEIIPGFSQIYGAVTVSIGIASNNLAVDTIETLISRADEALYSAKQTGRNQALFYEFKNPSLDVLQLNSFAVSRI